MGVSERATERCVVTGNPCGTDTVLVGKTCPGNEGLCVRRLERERDDALEALRKASVALDDWLNTYAAEFCDDGRVKEAYDRINDSGGTIAYIADLQQEIRALLGKGAG